MNYLTIRNIITGYENQLANAEIAQDQNQINWLKKQIQDGYEALATKATGYIN